MRRDELTDRLDALASPEREAPPPPAYMAKVTRRRWARRARLAVPAVLLIAAAVVTLRQAVRTPTPTPGPTPGAPVLAQADLPRTLSPDSLAALRRAGADGIGPGGGGGGGGVLEVLRPLDGYRAGVALLGVSGS